MSAGRSGERRRSMAAIRTREELVQVLHDACARWFGEPLAPEKREEFAQEFFDTMLEEDVEEMLSMPLEQLKGEILEALKLEALAELSTTAPMGSA